MSVASARALLFSALICALAFHASLDGQFVSDDRNAIVSNEWVTGPVRPAGIFSSDSWWGRARSDAPGYRPLVTLSFALNHAAGGLDVLGYHAVNVALHAVMSWLAYLLALELGMGRRCAFASMVMFALLPIHSEAVAWAVGRAELMAAIGFAVSLITGLRYRTTRSIPALAASAVFLLLGLFSKENAVTLLALPLTAAVLMPLPTGTRGRDLVWTAALLVALGVYLGSRGLAGEVLPSSEISLLDNPLTGLDTGSRLLGAVSILGRYLYLTFVPIPLSADYSFDELGIGAGFVADRYSLVGAAGILVAVVYVLRKPRSAVAMALALTIVSYSIVSNTVYQIGTIMGERLFYLPSLGICLACGSLCDSAVRRYGLPALAGLMSVACLYAVIDHERSREWATPVTLFESAVRASPRSARAHMELASAYGRVGRTEEALKSFEAAVAIKPDYAAAHYNKGNMLARNGRFREAEDAYRSAIEAMPKFASAWINLAAARQVRAGIGQALSVLSEALEVIPESAAVHAGRAEYQFMSGDLDGAIDSYSLALDKGGHRATMLANRAVVKQRRGGCAAAIDDYLAAAAAEPPAPEILSATITCLRRLGRHEEAADLSAGHGVANQPAGR